METTLAYLAGALDGNGFFTIQRSYRTKGKRYESHRPTYYIAKVGFTGTIGEEVQYLLKELFGGSVYHHQPTNAAHKPWTVWQATNKRARTAAEALLPYLRIKKRQAALIVEFTDLCARQWAEIKATQKPPYRLTAEITKAREHYWRTITQLNSPRNRRIHHLATPESSDRQESALSSPSVS